MLRRFTALSLCICVIGLTAMPASYLPCCCKKAHAAIVPTQSPCCRQHASQSMVGGSGMAQGMTPGHHGSCCSSQGLKKACPICRCLEQMQVVALAGSSVNETTIRVASETVPAISAALTASQSDVVAEILPEHHYPPGILITLRTCSFRC